MQENGFYTEEEYNSIVSFLNDRKKEDVQHTFFFMLFLCILAFIFGISIASSGDDEYYQEKISSLESEISDAKICVDGLKNDKETLEYVLDDVHGTASLAFPGESYETMAEALFDIENSSTTFSTGGEPFECINL